jgi:hypothetical protein
MRNAIAATAMLLAGVATAATAQDTTAAGRRQGADSIARSGQAAQADSAWKQGGQRADSAWKQGGQRGDSAWKQGGQRADSARVWGRDSLPQGAGTGRGEQDAVNPKLDAQGRPMQHADSSRNPGMTGQRADSSRNQNPSGTSSSIQTMEPSGTTTAASADGYLTYDDWKRDMDEVVRDRQVAKQHGVETGESATATGGQQGAWVDSTRRYDPQDSTKAGQRESNKAGKMKSKHSQSASGERQGSYETGAPGQQGNAASTPGNRDGTSSSANTGGTGTTSGNTSGSTTSGSAGTTPR